MERYLLKAPGRELAAWREAARGYPSFAEWLRCAAREKAAREVGLVAVVERPVAALPSSPVEPVRSSAQRLAERAGRCTADAPGGMTCKVCGKVHR